MKSFWQKLTGGSEAPPRESGRKTQPVGPRTVPVPARSTGHPIQLLFATAYDMGRVRAHNEDALFAFTSNLAGDESLPTFGLFVVADGMGGHLMGERASGLAARTMGQVVLEKLYLAALRGEADSVPTLHETMEFAVQAANLAVNQAVPGGGTTLTAALVFGNQVTLAHVGDSRAYLVQPDRIQPITRDHSLVQRLVDLGQITPDEAQVHPHRNVLIRAVGQEEALEVEVSSAPLAAGNRILLCSDGLWGLVDDPKLFEIINTSPSMQAACDQMVQAANQRGGADNIAAILIQMPDSPVDRKA